jgi:hypothetical protein
MVKFEDLEIWDYIKGYSNYKISSKGQVFNVKGNRFLKPCLDRYGYYYVSLYKDGKQVNHKVHRLVALTFYFVDDEKLQVDHKDRVKTNNNLLNLRLCSNSQNKMNTDIYQNNTCGLKGVSWRTQEKKWRARITINKKLKHLGYFNTKEDAYEAYKKASKELHGDFSYTP